MTAILCSALLLLILRLICPFAMMLRLLWPVIVLKLCGCLEKFSFHPSRKPGNGAFSVSCHLTRGNKLKVSSVMMMIVRQSIEGANCENVNSAVTG